MTVSNAVTTQGFDFNHKAGYKSWVLHFSTLTLLTTPCKEQHAQNYFDLLKIMHLSLTCISQSFFFLLHLLHLTGALSVFKLKIHNTLSSTCSTSSQPASICQKLSQNEDSFSAPRSIVINKTYIEERKKYSNIELYYERFQPAWEAECDDPRLITTSEQVSLFKHSHTNVPNTTAVTTAKSPF